MSLKDIISDSMGDEASLPGDSPILAVFKKAAKDLLERHDRHERVHRRSRDITIESKRIIFLLHSITTKNKTKESIVNEAKKRIQQVVNGPIKAIALDIENVSPYLHHKAFTAGLQEFVEARTFLSVIEQKPIISLENLRNELKFTVLSEDGHERIVSMLLTPQDYMLGLSDLTGEIMKKTISDLSTSNAKLCFTYQAILRDLYTGFLGLYGCPVVNNMKLKVTCANVNKVERAVFAYKVRRSEVITKPANSQPVAKPSTHHSDENMEED